VSLLPICINCESIKLDTSSFKIKFLLSIMFKGLVLPGMLVGVLLLAQGACAALFSAGSYGIAPGNEEDGYLATSGSPILHLQHRPYTWRVEPSNDRWTIQSKESGLYLGILDHLDDGSRVVLTPVRTEWGIEQDEHSERTYRIVEPRSPLHPQYGDKLVLTDHFSGHGGESEHVFNVEHLRYTSKSNVQQDWRFIRLPDVY
jgi:hypothetical protein